MVCPVLMGIHLWSDKQEFEILVTMLLAFQETWFESQAWDIPGPRIHWVTSCESNSSRCQPTKECRWGDVEVCRRGDWNAMLGQATSTNNAGSQRRRGGCMLPRGQRPVQTSPRCHYTDQVHVNNAI